MRSFWFLVFTSITYGQVDYILDVKNKPILDHREFKFTRTNGISVSGCDLSTAGLKVCTITKIPKGINGANTNHEIAIYNSSAVFGESVLISGGTAVSESASGTLQFTTVGTYTGSWTLRSATSGLEEALNYKINPHVQISTDETIRATINPPAGSTIECPGTSITSSTGGIRLTFTPTNIPLFNIIKDHVTVRGCHLLQSGTPVSGNTAIKTLAEPDGSPNDAQGPVLTNLQIKGFYDGIIVDGSSNAQVENIQSLQNLNDGVRVLGGGGRYINVLTNSNIGDGFEVTAGTFNTVESFCNHGWGIQTTIGLIVENSVLNNDWLGELLSNVSGASGNDVGRISNSEIQYAGDSNTICPGSAGSNTAPGIRVSGEPLRISNVQVFSSNGNGVEITGAGGNNIITNSRIWFNGLGLQANNIYGVRATNTFNKIVSNRIIGPNIITNGNNIFAVNEVDCNSASPCLDYTVGLNSIILGNKLNQSGAGNSITTVAGTSYIWSGNLIVAGTESHGGGRLNSDGMIVTNFAGLGTGKFIGEEKFCTNCAPTVRPIASEANAICAGTGTAGTKTVWNGTNWLCGP